MGEEIKPVSDKDEVIVRIPDIVEVIPIRVEPPIVVVVIHIEHVRVVVGIT